MSTLFIASSRRGKELAARRAELGTEPVTLGERRAELSRQNRLRQGLAGFAERVAASLERVRLRSRQRLLRLVVARRSG